MPTEIILINGVTLHAKDENDKPDDIIQRLRTDPVGGARFIHTSGFVQIEAEEGDFRIRPEHVTSVRWVEPGSWSVVQ